jgi:ribonuclease P protein subunit POP4
MAVTAETLVRHELVGLEVAVVAASNPDSVGLSGTVVTETTKTLGIDTGGRVAQVQKEGATFEWTLPGGERIRTAGAELLARPARRTERTGDSKWR